MSRQQTSAILLLVLALQVLPMSDTLAKHMSGSLPLLQVIWARFFFHCLITGIYSALRYGPETLAPTVSARLLARSASLFVAVGLFYVAIHFMPLTTALTLWFIAPFLLTLMARFFFREKVSAIQWTAIAAGFAGIFMAIRPSPETWEWIHLIGLLAGFGYAVFLLLTRLIETEIPPVVSVYQTGLVGCLASTAAVGAVWQQPAAGDWPILIAIGAVAAAAHLLIIKAFEKADTSTLAPFTYSEVIGAAMLGYAVFGDTPDMITCAGLSIVIASAIVVARYGNTPEAEATA